MNKDTVYKFLLLLYPRPYREQFCDEMMIVFDELYHEELARNGKVSIFFWIEQVLDIGKSALQAQQYILQREGLARYIEDTFHISIYAIIGIILIMPVCGIILTDIVATSMIGNRSAIVWIYNTPLFYFPLAPIWIIGFPMFAVALNLYPLLILFQKQRKLV